jgi:hypothetical protein
VAVGIVRVEGLREVDRTLRKMDAEMAKELRSESKDIAELVARDARSRVPEVSGAAKGSIKAGAQGKGAYVQGGKKTVPYYGWLDFGSRTPISGRPRSVGPWSKSGKGPRRGRFIYAALADNRGEVERRTKRTVKIAKQKAGLK